MNKNKGVFKEFWHFLFKAVMIYLILVVVLSVLSGSFIIKNTESMIMGSVLLVIVGYYFHDGKWMYPFFSLFIILLSLLYIGYQSNDLVGRMSAARFVTYVTCISIFVVLLNSLLKQRLVRGVMNAGILSALTAVLLLFIGYYISAGAWFSSDSLLAIMQTNTSEVKEYILQFSNPLSYIGSLAIVLWMAMVWYLLQNLSFQAKDSKRFCIGVALLVGAGISIYKSNNNLIANVFFDTQNYYKNYEKFSSMQLERQKRVKESNIVTNNKADGIYVLVIGESQNKDFMSAYGYSRNTTPWLKNSVDNGGVILFDNAYSCHTHTVQVLTYALTAKNQYNGLDVSLAPSLLEVVETAGYDTAWISNQVRYSAWDTPITVIASEANQQLWINHNYGETTSTNYYDEKLVESFDKIKVSKKMLVVIHLMGNHAAYDYRYPARFAKFSNGDDIDKYSNSILYNDYVVETIMQRVKKLPNFKAMLYVADHGEAVKEGFGHDAGKFTWNMTHIPLYTHFSDSYVKDNSEIVDVLKENHSSMITNDLIFNMLLAIMQIRGEGIYEPWNDITSSNYDKNTKRFRTMYNNKKITEEE